MGAAEQDRLVALVDLCRLIEGQTAALNLESLRRNRVELDALAYRLGHVGEGIKKLSDDLKFRHPEIDWTAIQGFRNIMFHEYLGIEVDKIWATAMNSLPILLAVLELELARSSQ